MCLCVINTYVCTYVYMYTYLLHLCHKQVHICTCVNVIIYSTTHTIQTHVQWQTCSTQTGVMIFERMQWCKKMPKIHAKSLYDALALLQKKLQRIYATGGPAGLLASLRCCFVLLTRGWERLEMRPPVALGSSPELLAFKHVFFPEVATALWFSKRKSRSCAQT